MLKYNPYPQQQKTIYYAHIHFNIILINLDVHFHLKRLSSYNPHV